MRELLPRGDGVGITEAHGVVVVRERMFALLLGALLETKKKKAERVEIRGLSMCVDP